MSNAGSSDQRLLVEAKAALSDKDTDRAAPLLAEVAERIAARAKDKIANDTA